LISSQFFAFSVFEWYDENTYFLIFSMSEKYTPALSEDASSQE